MTPQDLRMIHIAYDDDLDAIVLAQYILSTDWGVYFVELNKINCHKNCEGCYKPNDENWCLRCREGLRLVEGICTPKFIPCPSHMKENALGECQACDLNDPDKVNCTSCELSFDNNCQTCGPFSNPILYPLTDKAPQCGCQGYTKSPIVDGKKQPCKSPQCLLIADCYECDINNKCISCLTDGNKIINDGTVCAPGPCPPGTYPSYTYFRESAYCNSCPKDCLQCTEKSICNQCKPGTENLGEGLCYGIKFPLKFKVENWIDKNIQKPYTNKIDITITQADNSPLDVNYLAKYAVTHQYQLFLIQPVEDITLSNFSLLDQNNIRVSLKISDKYSGEKLKLKILKDTSKATQQIQLETETKELEILVPDQYTDKEIALVNSRGNTLGNMGKFTGGAADYGSFALTIFGGFDPSGNILKFSQMLKLLSRFRFLFIQFGVLLTLFFKASAIKYDPESTRSERYFLDHSKGYYGKFSNEKASLDILEKEMVNIVIYIVAWILKSQTYIILKTAQNTNSITRMQCHFVNFTQKIHFVAFNKTVLDLLFYGMRTIVHT